MNYLSTSYAYLSIFGDNFSPNELTQVLNIKPTSTGIKGEPSKYTRALKECSWNYKLNETDALEGLDESLNELVKVFKKKITLIKGYASKNELHIKCSIVIQSKNNENTGVLLSPEFINFLHELNASIEIDTYNA